MARGFSDEQQTSLSTISDNLPVTPTDCFASAVNVQCFSINIFCWISCFARLLYILCCDSLLMDIALFVWYNIMKMLSGQHWKTSRKPRCWPERLCETVSLCFIITTGLKPCFWVVTIMHCTVIKYCKPEAHYCKLSWYFLAVTSLLCYCLNMIYRIRVINTKDTQVSVYFIAVMVSS